MFSQLHPCKTTEGVLLAQPQRGFPARGAGAGGEATGPLRRHVGAAQEIS